MAEVEIDDLTSKGVIQDEPAYQLPPEAWSTGLNMRSFANGMERIGGKTGTLGTNPRSGGGAPVFVQYVSGPSQAWWLWATLTGIFVYDGATDTDITRLSGPYNATDAKDWTGTILGGVPILTTREDKPQFWNSYSSATKMADLTNWPANTTARVVRAFNPYLIALNITVSGANTPHRVKWSSSADPGSLPSTWDPADATHDAGQTDLADVNSGIILDGAELQGQFYIYKENAVWRQTFIGGQFIFDFKSFLETAGLLATRCVATTGDGLRHVFASQDDILVHNGYVTESILNKRMKRYLFNRIDAAHFDTSFMFCNPLFEEMWFCYPTQGSSEPNAAIIWNYRYNTLTEADGNLVDFVATSIGTVSTSTGTIWSAASSTWAVDPNPWAFAARRKVVTTQQTSKKLLSLDTGTTNDGVAFSGTLQRSGLGIIGRKRTGEWLEDFQTRKLIQRVWPKLASGTCLVRVGYQDSPQGAVTWTPYQTFTPATKVFVDGCLGSGRSVALEFSAPNDFHIDGYKLDLATLGKF